MLFFAVTMLSACAPRKPKPNMVQSERRFAKYVEQNQSKKTGNFIDLSEGPKQSYDAYLGPQNLNFDFKIVDPY